VSTTPVLATGQVFTNAHAHKTSCCAPVPSAYSSPYSHVPLRRQNAGLFLFPLLIPVPTSQLRKSGPFRLSESERASAAAPHPERRARRDRGERHHDGLGRVDAAGARVRAQPRHEVEPAAQRQHSRGNAQEGAPTGGRPRRGAPAGPVPTARERRALQPREVPKRESRPRGRGEAGQRGERPCLLRGTHRYLFIFACCVSPVAICPLQGVRCMSSVSTAAHPNSHSLHSAPV
jgi:hypothetical protein